MKTIMYLRKQLKKRGHNDFYIGFQCGLIAAEYKGSLLTDDTCNIITSNEYLKLQSAVNIDTNYHENKHSTQKSSSIKDDQTTDPLPQL